MNDLTIARLKISDKSYRVGNKVLCVNPGQKDAMSLVEVMKPYYKIHILVTMWTKWDPDITYAISSILDSAKDKKVKVYIHIPKVCRDLAKILKRDLEGYDNYKTIFESGDGTSLVIDAKTFNGIPLSSRQLLAFSMKDLMRQSVDIDLYMSTKIEGYSGEWEHRILHEFIPKHDFNLGGVFSSIYRKEDPELFKEDMIREFKRMTPRKILKAFKGDEDIWDYIMMQNSWESTVKMKTEDGKEISGSFEEQMNELAKEMIMGGKIE